MSDKSHLVEGTFERRICGKHKGSHTGDSVNVGGVEGIVEALEVGHDEHARLETGKWQKEKKHKQMQK